MKILVFSGGYLPAQNYGGPVVSLANFVELLGDEYEIDIVCKNHDLHDQTPFPGLQPGFHPVGKAQVCYLPDAALNRKNFSRILAERKPDFLYLSSIFDAKMNVPLLWLARQKGIPVVYAPRGELNPAVLQMKRWKKQSFLCLMRASGLYRRVIFQASSPEERTMILRALKVREEHVLVAPNLPSPPQRRTAGAKERGSLRIVFLARIHRSKNLAYAIARVLRLKGNIVFDIYGPVEHGDYWAQCQKEIQTAPPGIAIHYRGAVPVGTSGAVLGGYDCFLFPTLSENYGQVIAEAVQAGTLPVISRGTTPWDDLQGGVTIPLEDPEGFERTLQMFCDMDGDAFAKRQEALQKYAEEKIQIERLKAQTKVLFHTEVF